MDNSTVQSVGSISSISNSTQMYDTHGIGNSNANAEFVNQGLLLWNQTRDKWIDSRKPQTPAVQHSREPKLRTLLRYDVVSRILRELCWSATYDCLFESNKPFPKPVPLAELVDFLVDVWENEGMYD